MVQFSFIETRPPECARSKELRDAMQAYGEHPTAVTMQASFNQCAAALPTSCARSKRRTTILTTLPRNRRSPAWEKSRSVEVAGDIQPERYCPIRWNSAQAYRAIHPAGNRGLKGIDGVRRNIRMMDKLHWRGGSLHQRRAGSRVGTDSPSSTPFTTSPARPISLALNAAIKQPAPATGPGVLPWWPTKCASWPEALQRLGAEEVTNIITGPGVRVRAEVTGSMQVMVERVADGRQVANRTVEVIRRHSCGNQRPREQPHSINEQLNGWPGRPLAEKRTLEALFATLHESGSKSRHRRHRRNDLRGERAAQPDHGRL